MAGRLQNEDFKTLSELTGAGGATNQLLNDTKIYITNAALAAQLSSLITSGDVLTSASLLKLGISTDSTTTGTAAALPAATKGILRLTNASLVSISTITGQANGQYFVLINRTGNSITINDNDAANGIRTGTGAAMTVTNNASVVIAYDNTSARSQVIGGSGGSIATPVAIADGGTGQTTASAAFNALSPMTTAGDLIYGGASGAGTRLPIGSTGQVLSVVAGNPAWAAASSGVGATNYISNYNAEVDTAGWATYADAAGTVPVDGTGGSPTLTFTRTTSSPLSGSASFLITKDAANRQGNGASYDFTIDAADKAKVLQISFQYIVASGTFVAGNPTDRTSAGDSDITVWIYDVTNGVLISPSTTRLYSNSSTIADKFVSNFQSSSNSTSYRLIFHCGTTSAAAYTLKADTVLVTPSSYVYGSPITDWTSYTPTFNGSPTTASVTFWSRRVGDSLQIIGSFQLTLVNASTTAITMPSGLSIDTTKVGTTKRFVFGEAARIVQTASETTLVKHVVAYNTSFTNQLFLASTSLSQNLGVHAWSDLFVNNDWVTVDALVPIAGWSSSVQMSDSADTRIVDCVVTTTANITGTSGSAFIFPVVTKDSHGAYNSSTGVFTVPVAGDYQIGATGMYNNVGDLGVILRLNGNFNNNLLTTDTARPKSGYAVLPNLRVGDTITLTADATRNLLYSAGNYIPTMSISRIAGPVAIAATETVAAVATAGGSQSISATTETTVNYDTVTFDTHGAITTGASWKFTCPVAGIYEIGARVNYNNTSGTNIIYRITAFKNGSNFIQMARPNKPTGTFGMDVIGQPILIKCIAGDYLHASVNNDEAGTVSSNSFITIKRIGG